MPTTTPTATIICVLRVIATHDSRIKNSVIPGAIHQAADRLEEQEAALDNYRLRDEVRALMDISPVWVNQQFANRWWSLTRLKDCLNREIKEWEERE